MALKNKDGTIFKLRGPNPLMNQQQFWDRGKVTLINMVFSEVTNADTRRTPEKVFREYHAQPEPQQEPVSNVGVLPRPQPKPKIQVDSDTAQLLRDHKVIFLCLPVEECVHKDELYNEKYSTYQYGEKTSFAGIIVAEGDLSIQFWTDRGLMENSIVYPQTKSARWWRVTSSEPRSGGYFCAGVASDVNPSFS